MKFGITVLGCSSAIPAYGRHPSAQVLFYDNQPILIDCGEATQMRLMDFKIRSGKIDHIFISHLHGDHFYGLPGLITSFDLLGREKPLYLYAHSGLEVILNALLGNLNDALRYPLNIIPVDPNGFKRLADLKYLEVFSFPLDHRIECSGFLFKEKEKKRNYNPEAGRQYNVPIEWIERIKSGEDYVNFDQQTIPNHLLTFDPPQSKSYVYMTDTRITNRFNSKIKGADLLYHEATFIDKLKERAQITFHSTALQAGQFAKKINAGKLIIGHFSAKHRDLLPLLDEAKEEFENTELAIEGNHYPV